MKKQNLINKINTIKKQLNGTANTIYLLENSITDDDCITILRETDKAIKHINNIIQTLSNNKYIKCYHYCLNKDTGDLEIFIITLDNKEYSIATISNCNNKTDKELDNLTQEILEEQNYILGEEK